MALVKDMPRTIFLSGRFQCSKLQKLHLSSPVGVHRSFLQERYVGICSPK